MPSSAPLRCRDRQLPAAKILIDKDGAEPSTGAGQRTQESLDVGDEEGAVVCANILLLIVEMQRDGQSITSDSDL